MSKPRDKGSAVCTEKTIDEVVEVYSDMLFRIALQNMKNTHDVEDIVQDTLMKYIERLPAFESEEHEKAWLIRVCINLCNDRLKSAWFKRRAELDENIAADIFEDNSHAELFSAVAALPAKMKNVVYLYYFEEYSIKEIAEMTDQSKNTVGSLLHRARAVLRETLGERGEV